jgi:hypothetical protein
MQVVMLLQYILPVLIMAYSYTMMVVTIWRKREIGEVIRHSKDNILKRHCSLLGNRIFLVQIMEEIEGEQLVYI